MKQFKVTKYMDQFFNTNEELTFFDIGSCDGIDSIEYSKHFPNASIFSFEPVKNNFIKIIQNIKENKTAKIFPFNIALGNKKGRVKFHLSSVDEKKIPGSIGDSVNPEELGNKSGSLLQPELHEKFYPWISFTEAEDVDVETISEFCSEHSIRNIDFIHMDVQGAELIVLEGAKDFIDKINLVWMEVSKVSYYKNQPLQKDVESFMRAHGFLLLKDNIDYPHGDRLYIRKNFFILKKGKLNYFLKKLMTFGSV